MRGARSAAPLRAFVTGPSARLAERRTRLPVGFSVASDAGVPDRGSGCDETLPYDDATLPTNQKDAVKELRRQPSPRSPSASTSPVRMAR
jgi:hypothetical protein